MAGGPQAHQSPSWPTGQQEADGQANGLDALGDRSPGNDDGIEPGALAPVGESSCSFPIMPMEPTAQLHAIVPEHANNETRPSPHTMYPAVRHAL
ncbi:MAG: hypothetical protein SPE31_03850 [Prevotella sp.]|nr:hypothetical protein [Prevotella sp.]